MKRAFYFKCRRAFFKTYFFYKIENFFTSIQFEATTYFQQKTGKTKKIKVLNGKLKKFIGF